MADMPAPTRPPQLLLANAHEWFARALESILRPAGYAVVKAYSALDALAAAHRSRPDAIVLDTELPETDGFELCRLLRVDPDIAPSTPIVLTTPRPAVRSQMLAALRAGANDLWGQPLDAAECVLRLQGFLRAKQDADRARERGLVDQATDFYNVHGLERRARELGAEAARLGGPLACLVLAPERRDRRAAGERAAPHNGADPQVEALARLLKAAGRMSDAIGRLGPREFAVLAPNTDAAGAASLAERLAQAVPTLPHEPGAPPLRLRGGYVAAARSQASALGASELLNRALWALRAAERGTDKAWLCAFEAPPPPP
jgi:PleD family two-component response regulator